MRKATEFRAVIRFGESGQNVLFRDSAQSWHGTVAMPLMA